MLYIWSLSYSHLLPLRRALKHGADSGTLAEEVISTIRTAQAFGTQNVLAELYEVFCAKGRQASTMAAALHGGAMAVFFFVSYAAYALGV